MYYNKKRDIELIGLKITCWIMFIALVGAAFKLSSNEPSIYIAQQDVDTVYVTITDTITIHDTIYRKPKPIVLDTISSEDTIIGL